MQHPKSPNEQQLQGNDAMNTEPNVSELNNSTLQNINEPNSSTTQTRTSTVQNATTKLIELQQQSALPKGKSRLTILASLPKGQRFTYFKDQLLLRVTIAVVTLVILIFLAFHILAPAPSVDLRIASVNPLLNQSQAETLNEHITALLNHSDSTQQYNGKQDDDQQNDGEQNNSQQNGNQQNSNQQNNDLQNSSQQTNKHHSSSQQVSVDTGFGTDGSELNKLQIMLSNGDIDLIIAPKHQFEQLAAYGYLVDITSIFDKATQTQLPKPLQTRGFDDTDNKDAYYDGTGKGALASYGFDTSQSSVWRDWHMPEAYIGIAQDSSHLSQAKTFITALFEKQTSESTEAPQ